MYGGFHLFSGKRDSDAWQTVVLYQEIFLSLGKFFLYLNIGGVSPPADCAGGVFVHVESHAFLGPPDVIDFYDRCGTNLC